MPDFFTDSVENKGNSYFHTLEKWGNFLLSPLSSYSNGRAYTEIGKENRWQGENSGDQTHFHAKRAKEPLLRPLLLVPGIFMGSILKGVAFLSQEVQARNTRLLTLERAPVIENDPYNEVTRRIYNRTELEEKLNAADPDKLDHLKAALDQGNWKDAIFQDPDFPYYALRLLKDGKISQSLFGTIQIFWTAKQTFGDRVQVVPLFNSDGTVHLEAKKMIAHSLENPQSYDLKSQLIALDRGLAHKKLFAPENVDAYLDKMRERPLADQFFFHVRHQPVEGESWVQSNNKTIGQVIQTVIGINALNGTESGHMIPTAGMMQQFLETFLSGDPVTINPVLGLSTIEDIRRNGENDTRDMAIAFPGITLPDKADGFEAPGFEFTYHDFYHSILASCMSRDARRRMIRVADFLKEESRHSFLNQGHLKRLRHRIVDMEFSAFRPDTKEYHNFEYTFVNSAVVTTPEEKKKLNEDARFWYSVANAEWLDTLVELDQPATWRQWLPKSTHFRERLVKELDSDYSNPQLLRDYSGILKAEEVFRKGLPLVESAKDAADRFPEAQRELAKKVLAVDRKQRKEHPILSYHKIANERLGYNSKTKQYEPVKD